MDIQEVYKYIVEESVDTRQKGTRYERAVKFFLENDPSWSSKLDEVWLWEDAPVNGGDKKDYGVDLVARDAADGSLWAIQAKCYSKSKLAESDVSTFLGFAGIHDDFQHLVIADTTPGGWTSNLRKIVQGDDVSKDVVRLSLDDLADSNLDWDAFASGNSQAMASREVHEPRPHQREAINMIKGSLADNDRCVAVMACGTGKTLMSLRLAEELCPGGTVLFLAPSISLVSQSLKEWSNQVRGKINPYVICSDATASKLDEESYGSLLDMPFPATTNPQTIASRFKGRNGALNVVFSTYQSIDRVHEAQELGLPEFDLAICDEAHRTTGVMDGEASFQKIHDSEFIRASKRVYMTATPRIFGEGAKQKAKEGAIQVASMDDVDTYGPVAYRLSFGKAVSLGLLTDYKIVVMKISESMISSTMQRLSARDDLSLDVPDVAKFLGCWKALFDRKHDASHLETPVGDENLHSEDTRTLKHAIAFAASIKASKSLSREFQTVIDTYLETIGEEAKEGGDLADVQRLVEANRRVDVELEHVDGTMSADVRKEHLKWLTSDGGDDTCHILSNARCLAEGVDVPALDAVIYLSSRKSKVDIIQSVGRVMRRAEGKSYGYIIIPVFIPVGTDDAAALASSKEYKVVWDVVRALRSHDERLDAVINAGNFDDTSALERIVEVDVLDESKLERHADKKGEGKSLIGEGEPTPGSEVPENYVLDFGDDDLRGLGRAVRAQIVKKCGTKIYWTEWTDRVAGITRQRVGQIADLVAKDGPVRERFCEFLEGIRDSLNEGFGEAQAIETLAQHEVTRPIFVALFDNDEVGANNPITKGLDRALESLYAAGLPRSTDDRELSEVYASVRDQVRALTTDASRQRLVKEIYNDFFKVAFKDTHDSLGIVYTPVEVVDAQLHMVQRALMREFGISLGERGVHVLDGFAGTGTYMCRLIEDETLIADEDLPYKYANDLHSNEIVPLAATIMDINIEQSYHSRIGGDYVAFRGALLTDTFQMHESGNTLDDHVFTENTERVVEQCSQDIQVIIGNPPYRAGDKDNTGNQNAKYPTLDARIEETYAAGSSATLKNSLYDHYVRAFRWASDRIGDRGVVCFVSNGGWLNGGAAAGMRKSLVEEFNSIYVFNLRGNAMCQGKARQKERGNVFGEGTRTTIAITMLVKNPDSNEHGAIHYRDIGDYLTRDEKLRIVSEAVEADPEWEILEPDSHGDWLGKRDDAFYEFIPCGVKDGNKKTPLGLFTTWSQGVKTNRDEWCYNFNRATLAASMRKCVETYQSERERWHEAGCPKDVKSFLTKDPKAIKWTFEVYQDMSRDKPAVFHQSHLRHSLYRPFCRQWLYMDSQFNNRTYLQPSLFPYKGAENLEICVTGPGNAGFSCLMVDQIPCLDFQQKSQCFPLYSYERTGDSPTEASVSVQTSLFGNDKVVEQPTARDEASSWVRHDAINDVAFDVFREAYPEVAISKEDIFYYVYGVMHSPEYRRRFANSLTKELPRIPLARDFPAFAAAGRALAELHVNYEKARWWPGLEFDGNPGKPGRTTKMRWGKKTDPETGKKVNDYTTLVVAESLTIKGIPERAQDYVVNGRSPLAWAVDQYQYDAHEGKSGIVNDPNSYSRKPWYIADLVRRLITVSMGTLEIVESLPPLNELDKTSNWPVAWNAK